MKKHFTKQQIDEAKSILATVYGSKGGKGWWNSLTEEQRKERIQKLVEARRKKQNVAIEK